MAKPCGRRLSLDRRAAYPLRGRAPVSGGPLRLSGCGSVSAAPCLPCGSSAQGQAADRPGVSKPVRAGAAWLLVPGLCPFQTRHGEALHG